MTGSSAAPAKTGHAIVVGAGIVGVSTCLYLQRDGWTVTLIDRAGPGEGTSYGNGGVLASCSMVPVTVPGLVGKAPRMLLDPDQPLFLKWSYLPRLLPWLAKYLRNANAADTTRIASAIGGIVSDSLEEHQALAAGTPAEKWIVPSDYLYIYDARENFEKDSFGWALRKANGIAWEELESAEFKRYDPVFADHLGFAVRMGNHGRIADPGQYVKDLAQVAVDRGARLLKSDVTDILHESGRVSGVRAGGDTIQGDAVVIATGPWSKPLARGLGIDVPLESERGYHLELWNPSVTPRSPVMVASGKFVATPMEGRLRLAGVVEFGGLEAPPSDAPIALLKKNAKSAFPGITWDDTKEWMGHRPAPADSIPVIGAVPGRDGAYMAFGHHHIGLTGGPKTGRLLAQLMSGRTPNIDLAAYSPARFA